MAPTSGLASGLYVEDLSRRATPDRVNCQLIGQLEVASAPLDPVPVVAIHGVLDSSRSFGRLARTLASTRQVIAYDRRGYQRSRGTDDPPRLSGHVDDLLAVLETYTPAGAVVLGHSYGGIVALAAASRGSSLLRGVVSYEPPLSWMPWWTDALDAGSRALVPRPGQDPAEFADEFANVMIGPERWSRLGAAIKAEILLDGRAAATELSDLARAVPFDPTAIHVPVVVVRGSAATARHARGASWFVEHVPGAKLEVLDDAGHQAHLSAPHALGTIVEELAAKVDASRR